MQRLFKSLLTLIAVLAFGSAFAQQQTINLGSTANDGTGDTLRSAGAKINHNDAELYALFPINLGTNVTGDLPLANLTQGSARSVLGVTGNSTADEASIQGTANQVLRVNGAGTALAFGQIDLSQSAAVTGDLPFANLAQGSALSVLGVTGNAGADVASITAGADGNILRRAGTAVGFGSIDLADADAVGSTVLPLANGGGLTTATDDSISVGNGTILQSKALTSCSAASSAVTYNTSTNAFGCNTITGATVAGSDTQVQFNDGGAFGADAGLVWDKTNDVLKLGVAGTTTGEINGPTAQTVTSTGATIRFRGGPGGATSGAGGIVQLIGGTPVSGAGGGAFVTGANGQTSGAGGAVTITGGSGASASNGGDIALTTGAGAGAGVSGSIAMTTGVTQRLTIEPDGSWNVGGSNGTSGQVLTSAGSTSPPTWSTAAVTVTTGSFTANWTQACSTTPTQTWNYTLVGAIVVLAPVASASGDIATCTGDVTFFISSTDMPSAIRPNVQTTVSGMFTATNNGSSVNACLRLQPDGSMELLNSTTNAVCSTASNSWTNSGNRSAAMGQGYAFTYQLDNN